VIKAVFVAEMLLSPVVAAIAVLVPLAANLGTYEYLPALFWLAMLVQCLITFRWRALWFLLGPPVAVAGIVAFLVAAPPVRSVLGALSHGVSIDIARLR